MFKNYSLETNAKTDLLLGDCLQITAGEELDNLDNNKFHGHFPNLINSKINFNGKNNLLVCEENVTLVNSNIDFNEDNSILYLSSSSHSYRVNISLNGNNVCFFGKDNYFNAVTAIVLSESKNVIIGDGCLFSYDIFIRVSDVHLLYSRDSRERINHSKSIYIGDHVWFGQKLLILKGTRIGSGAVIGAGSVVTGKEIPSNTTFAGNPAKLIRDSTFWTAHSNHTWNEKDTKKLERYEYDFYEYEKDETSLDFDSVELLLNSFPDVDAIEDYIKSDIIDAGKNRFAL